MKNQINLIKSDSGYLNLPDDEILLYFYKAGDVDQIKADNPNLDHLACALFDARETGEIPSATNSAKLPNGDVIEF